MEVNGQLYTLAVFIPGERAAIMHWIEGLWVSA